MAAFVYFVPSQDFPFSSIRIGTIEDTGFTPRHGESWKPFHGQQRREVNKAIDELQGWTDQTKLPSSLSSLRFELAKL